MPSVTEIDHLNELEDRCLAWTALWNRTASASFFQSLPWLRATWRDSRRDRALRVLAVESSGELIGFLPLAMFGQRRAFGQARVLAYAGHDRSLPGGPIGPNPTATLCAALRYLFERGGEWDELHLCGTHAERAKTALQTIGCRFRERTIAAAGRIEFGGDWRQHFAKLSAPWKAHLRENEEKLAAMGAVTYERYRPLGAARGDDEAHWDVFSACLAPCMSAHSAAAVGDAPIWEVHRQAAKSGGLDLNVLRIEGEIAAYCYNVHHQGRVDAWCAGANERFAAAEPLAALIKRMLQDSFRRGDASFCYHGPLASLYRPWSIAGAAERLLLASAPRGALWRRGRALRLG